MLRKILLCAIILLLPLNTCASEGLNEMIDKELQKLSTDTFDLVEFKNSFVEEGELPRVPDIVKGIIDIIFKEAAESIRSLLLLVIPLMLTGVLSNLSLKNDGVVRLAETVCVLSLTAGVVNTFLSAISVTEATLSELNIMSLSMLPVMYSLLLSMGRISTYTILHPTVMFLTHFMMNIMSGLLIPAATSGFMLNLSDSIAEKARFRRISTLLIKLTKWLLIFMISIFVTVLSAQNILTHSFDTVALKGSKFVVANFVPVVGGAIADGAEALGSSLLLIKNAAGVAGLVGVAVIVFTPVIRIFIIGISFYILSAISQLASMDKLSEVLDISAGTVNMLGAIVLSTAFLFVISIAVMLGG